MRGLVVTYFALFVCFCLLVVSKLSLFFKKAIFLAILDFYDVSHSLCATSDEGKNIYLIVYKSFICEYVKHLLRFAYFLS